MAIHLDIYAQLHGDEAAREADRLAEQLERAGTLAGQHYGANFGKGFSEQSPAIQRSFNAVENAVDRVKLALDNLDKVKKNSKSTDDDLERASIRVTIARRAEADAHRAAGAALQKYQDDIDKARRKAEEAANELERAGKNANDFGKMLANIANAIIPGSGIGMAALPIVGALVDLVPVAASASQSLLLIPTAAGGAITALGTLKLATEGFDNALKNMSDPVKFAAALEKLSPNAQQLALSIKDLIPWFDKLKNATQDSFMAGFGRELNDLTTRYMPSVQIATTGIASAFNSMFANIGKELSTPGTQGSIETFLTNTTTAFKALAPAVAPFTNALSQLMSIGSGELPKMSAALTGMANSFSNFINNANNTGQLQHWMDEGLNTMTQLSGVVGHFVTDFMSLAPVGDKILPDIVGALNETSDVLRDIIKLSADNDNMFGLWKDVLTDIDPIIKLFDVSMKSITISVGDSTTSLKDWINPIHTLADLINSIKWFLDPGNRDDATKRALDKLNAARAAQGLAPAGRNDIDENGNVKPATGATGASGAGALFPGGTGPGPLTTAGMSPALLAQINAVRAKHGEAPLGTDAPIPLPPGAGPTGIGSSVGWVPATDHGEWGPLGNPFGAPTTKPPKGKKPKFDAPIGQWSLDSIPIGAFGHGVPDIGAAPTLPGMPFGTNATAPDMGLDKGLPGLAGLLGGTPGGLPFGKGGGAGLGGVVDPLKVYEAQTSELQARQRVEETRQTILKLEHDNTATQDDIIKARNAEVIAERELLTEQAKVTEAQRGTTRDMKSGMDALGAALDPDFGLSKGLAGLAENLTKFVGNLLAAPFEAKMNAITNADPIKGGYGLLGIRGAQNMAAGLSPLLGQPYAPGMDPYLGYDTPGGPASTAGGVPPSAATTSGAYAGDAALLANVPAGRYNGAGGTADLTKGLGDCSSAVEDLVNLMDGTSTAGRSMSTGNEASWLTQRGFLPTNQPMPGTFQVGFDPAHTQATLPGGTPFNWGSDEAAARGGVGGSGAWDPAFTSHFYRPVDGSAGPPVNGGPATGGGVPGSGTPALSSGGVVPVYVTNMGGAGLGAPAAGSPPASGTPAAPSAGGSATPPIAPSNPLPSGQGKQVGPSPPAGGKWVTNVDGSKTAVDAAGNATGGYIPGGGAGTLPTTVPGGGSGGPMPTSPINFNFGGNGNGPGLPNLSGQVLSPNAVSGSPPNRSGTLWRQGDQYTPIGTPSGGSNFGLDQILAGDVGKPPISPSIGPPPIQPPAGGGGSATPPIAPAGGTGATPIGGIAPPPQGKGSGGIGITPGGTLDTALNLGAMAFPGMGQLAQTGVKEANRAIQFAGQAVGIGVQGLAQTFLPTGGSALAQNSWFSRLVGGLAGATPQIPNTAGQPGGKTAPPPLTPQQALAQHQGTGAPPGPDINVTYNNNGATEDRAAADLTHHLSNMNGAMQTQPAKPSG